MNTLLYFSVPLKQRFVWQILLRVHTQDKISSPDEQTLFVIYTKI